MKIIQSHPHEPTPEEVKELEKFKARIERAVADGKISSQEIEEIKNEIFTKTKGAADRIYRELEMYRILVTEKLQAGTLEEEW